MDFIKYIENIPNITIAKKIASAYVADYRRLDFDQLKEFLIKTAKQYTSYENISNRLDELKLDNDRTVRIIAPILLRDYLINQDDFISLCKETDSAILNYEKLIVDEANMNNFETKALCYVWKEMLNKDMQRLNKMYDLELSVKFRKDGVSNDTGANNTLDIV